jgi:hypothetical protein
VPGDVIEFTRYDNTRKGLLFSNKGASKGKELCIQYKSSNRHSAGWDEMHIVSGNMSDIKVLYHDSAMEHDMSRPNNYSFIRPSKVTSSKYIPKAGDVVEFEFNSNLCKGLIFIHAIDAGKPISIAYDGSASEVKHVNNIRKIGYTDVSGIKDYQNARKCLDKYFSEPTFTGTYEERQKQWIKHHGLITGKKIGSKVRVVKSCKGSTPLKGVYRIEEVHSDGIETTWNHDHLPYTVFDIVK